VKKKAIKTHVVAENRAEAGGEESEAREEQQGSGDIRRQIAATEEGHRAAQISGTLH
jgi:hypothetical protein